MIRTSLLTILAAGVAIAFAAPVSAQTNFSRDDVRTKRDQEIEQRRSTRDERQQQFRDTRDSRLGTYQGNFQDKKKSFVTREKATPRRQIDGARIMRTRCGIPAKIKKDGPRPISKTAAFRGRTFVRIKGREARTSARGIVRERKQGVVSSVKMAEAAEGYSHV